MARVTLRLELEWIGISLGIEVDCRCVSDDSGALWDDIAFIHDIVIGEMSQDPWRGRAQTQDFFEASVDIGKFGQVIIFGGTRVADDFLKLLERFSLSRRRRCKIENQIAECCCRRL